MFCTLNSDFVLDPAWEDDGKGKGCEIVVGEAVVV